MRRFREAGGTRPPPSADPAGNSNRGSGSAADPDARVAASPKGEVAFVLMYRTLLLMVLAAGLVVGILLTFALLSSWTTTRNLAPAIDHLDRYTALVEARRLVLDGSPDEAPEDVAAMLDALIDDFAGDSQQSAADLAEAAARLRAAVPARDEAARLMRHVAQRELATHRALIDVLDADAERGLNATVALIVVLPVLTVAFLVLLYHRVMRPLQALGEFFNLLARKEYVMVGTRNVDPMLRPLFERYSRLVKRLHVLETAHVNRENALRRETDLATRALFEQQLDLARTERLAAVAEVAARLSHELRNPLSGVLMTLSNLRTEPASEDRSRRLDLAIHQLKRMGRVLRRALDYAKQDPEPAVELRLHDLVADLMQIAGYQIPVEIDLQNRVDEDIRCTLPKTGLRQAILNLILNAGQALAGRPGRICVDASLDGDKLVIRVVDDGPGFADELLQSGVREFGNWRKTGSGIGLVTATRFAYAQGGRLELSNEDGGGACARLIFPTRAVADPEA